MDENEEQYMGFVKKDIKKIRYVEDPHQQMMMIDAVLKELCPLGDEQLINEIKQFNDKNQKIEDQYEKLVAEIDTLKKQSADNYLNMYEKVLKPLV